MNASLRDAFGVRKPLVTPAGTVHVYRLDALASQLGADLGRLPYSIRVLLEAALRHCDDYQVTQDDVKRLARWQATGAEPVELPFKPARVILQDFTGVPCVVDLAAMREAVKRMGADPLHRRAVRGGSRRDARGGEADGRRSAKDQPARPRGP